MMVLITKLIGDIYNISLVQRIARLQVLGETSSDESDSTNLRNPNDESVTLPNTKYL